MSACVTPTSIRASTPNKTSMKPISRCSRRTVGSVFRPWRSTSERSARTRNAMCEVLAAEEEPAEDMERWSSARPTPPAPCMTTAPAEADEITAAPAPAPAPGPPRCDTSPTGVRTCTTAASWYTAGCTGCGDAWWPLTPECRRVACICAWYGGLGPVSSASTSSPPSSASRAIAESGVRPPASPAPIDSIRRATARRPSLPLPLPPLPSLPRPPACAGAGDASMSNGVALPLPALPALPS
mmetsp:Transcript_2711/g.8143  ORF Transcript_2711/g.8143 Transcript_2711/m.8143 type:complete len:241 (-) Transcript_2711:130-852(-)